LLLAFYSLGVLNAYWGGIALILLAVGLFIAEYFTSSFGLLTAGGVASLVAGSLILFSYSPGIEVDKRLIAGVAVGVTAFAVFVIGAIVRGQRRRKATGPEGMIGTTATAKTPLDPTGTVLAEGELWTAASEGGRVEPGEEVIVNKVEGLKLRVAKKSK
jgi:membrane-bound serine protease (ClpP class)